jgi:hypothetical protein
MKLLFENSKTNSLVRDFIFELYAQRSLTIRQADSSKNKGQQFYCEP